MNTATIGVDRVGAGTSTPGEPGEPGDELFGLETDAPPAQALLDRVAALTVYVTAGHATEPEVTPFEPVADDLQPCSAQAGSLLQTILDSRHASLLDEWCRLAGERGQRVPHALLPAVLEEAVSSNSSRNDAIAAVIGSRGRWLAAQNKRWALYAADGRLDVETVDSDMPLLEQWETGSKGQRVEAMLAMRAADPGAAREALLASFGQDAAADRADFARTLAVGLSTEDEPALEGMLDDRSSQVRDAAADLLSILEGSALSRRMVERAERAVGYTPAKGKLRRKPAELALTLPAKLDDEAARDAITEKAAQGMGAKAAAMSRIIARTPLVWWEQKGLDADGWVKLGLSSDWGVPLVVGWAGAAHLQQNPGWSSAIIGRVCLVPAGQRAALNDHWRGERLAELITHLDAAKLRALIDAHLPADAGKHYAGQLIELLRACPGPWGVDLSQRVLRFLRQAVTNPNVVYDNTLRSFIERVAGVRLSIEIADSVGEDWPTDAKHWSANFEALIDRLIRTVRLRQQMHAALTNHP